VTAWHGSHELKERTVAKMRLHREKDAFVRGTYQILEKDLPTGYRGCAVGCLLDKQSVAGPDEYGDCLECGLRDCAGCPAEPADGWHGEVYRQFGIPSLVAAQIDNVFEMAPGHDTASDFAVAVVEAIPVGADLTGVADALLAWARDATGDEYYDYDVRIGKLFELIAAAPVEVSDAAH
jgi:hypothetical protein